jgi:hypothetical protein
MTNAQDQGKLPNSGLLDLLMDYNSKLVEFGSLNVNAALEGAVKLADAKSPPEFFQILTGLTREQFERLSEQIEELSALAPLTEGRGADKTDSTFWE